MSCLILTLCHAIRGLIHFWLVLFFFNHFISVMMGRNICLPIDKDDTDSEM